MQLKTYFAQDASGNIIPNAQVFVYLAGTTTLATGIVDQSGAPLTNPFNADSSAAVVFAAPDGDYDVKCSGASRTVTIRAQFFDGGAFKSDLAATGGSALVGADDGAGGSLWTTVAGFIAFLLSSLGASVIGFIQAGVGAVQRTLQAKAREVVTVTDFGASATAGVDSTDAIKKALSAVPAGGVVRGVQGETYEISDRIDINGRTLKGIKLKLTANAAFLVLSGDAKLRTVEIDANGKQRLFGHPLFGYVNLHNASGVEIDRLKFKNGATTSSGVFCSTKASDTTITRSDFDEVGFGIYFLDAERTAGVDVRLVDGVSYTGSIGSGLTVSFCKLGNSAKAQAGDGIEIDVPNNRFDTIDVSHNIVRGKTPSGAKTGLGMGFANVDLLTVSYNKFINTVGTPGALHIEDSNSATLANNQFSGCTVGIGAGLYGNNTIMSGNTFMSCNQPIVVNGGALAPYRNLKIAGNQIINTTGFPVQLVDVQDVDFVGNTIRNIATAGNQLIYLVQSLQASVSNINISGNTFIKDNSVGLTVLSKSGAVSSVFTKGNIFSGISTSEVATYYTLARTIGLCEEYVSITSTALSGLSLRTNSNPTGYVTAPAGSFVTDVVTGTEYRSDGTNWLPFVVRRGVALYDPPSLADGAGVTTTVTVTGATLGDYADASFGPGTQGVMLTAWVSSADTVSVRFQNETGGTVDLGSGNLRAQVISK